MSGEEYKFYVKVSPDGKSLGDCPFSQRANLAFKVKKVPTTYTLIDLSNKPKWFLELNSLGSVPVVQYGDTVLNDSYGMVQYLDSKYPSPSLKPPGNDEAEKVTADIFTKFSGWAKHSKEPNADQLKEEFIAELKKVDEYLGKGEGALLCGTTWSVADCVFAPRIYHINAVASHFLGYDVGSFANVKRYMGYTFGTDEFKATDYPTEYILVGWAKYFE